MTARTYFRTGSLASLGGFSITPTTGYVLFLSEGSIRESTAAALRIRSQTRTDTFGPIYATEGKIFQVATESVPITIYNSSAGTVSYTITGDEIPLSEAGGLESVVTATSVLADNTSTTGVDLLNLIPGKALEVTSWGISANNVTTGASIRLRDATSKAAFCTLPTASGGHGSNIVSNYLAGYVLWPELNLEPVVIFNGSTGSGYGFVRANQYDATTWSEKQDRLLIDTSVVASGFYDLHPPVGEIWYVDVWFSAATTTTLSSNGVSAIAAAATPVRFSVTDNSWMRFSNPDASARRLVIIGAKAKA